jgi:hypothetical protein
VIENQVRERLLAVGDRHRPLDLTDRVIERGRRRRRARMLAVVVTAVTLLVGVGLFTVAAQRDGEPSLATARPATTRATPTAEAQYEAMFRVAPPQAGGVGGPAPLRHRPCQPDQVVATAELRRSASAVNGVVVLRGSGCSLRIWPGPTQLLDANQDLVAATSDGLVARVNPPSNIRPDLALEAGTAAWGFSWRGSWCGAAAAYVVLPLQDSPGATQGRRYGRLLVPITGDQLQCKGSSHSVLVPGVAGSLGSAVLPPPAQWDVLRLSLSIPARVDYNVVRNIVVSITNPSAQPVALDPCPTYVIVTAVPYEADTSPGLLDCEQNAVIAAHATVTFRLPDHRYDEGAPPGQQARSGSPVVVSFAIAYHATVTARAQIR